MREQLWILPSQEPGRVLRATVFRPADLHHSSENGAPIRHPLVVINHGTDEYTRLAVSTPVYYWLSRWFVERGYVVVLPQRRGHGATGGELSESVGTCENPDHYASGIVAANDIVASIDYMNKQSFVATNTVVVGISTGGWASLALAARNPSSVRAIVNFAGGRGGHAYGQENVVCGERKLLQAAGLYAASARIPTVWYYSENDSYFAPRLANRLAHVWRSGGGSVEDHVVPAYGTDGHEIADDRAGWELWGVSLEDFLRRTKNLQQPEVKVVTEAAVASEVSSGNAETSFK